jgi:hypothetical protein
MAVKVTVRQYAPVAYCLAEGAHALNIAASNVRLKCTTLQLAQLVLRHCIQLRI